MHFLPRASVVTLTLLTGTARLARADAGAPLPDDSPCGIDLRPSEWIPANLPAFVVRQQDDGGASVPNDVIGLEQKFGDGGLIPLTPTVDPKLPSVTLLGLGEELMIGSEYIARCGDAGAHSGTTTFQSAVNVELPWRTGVVDVKESGVVYVPGTVFVTLDVHVLAYLEVVRFELLVDGVSAGSTPYGAFLQDFDDTTTFGISVRDGQATLHGRQGTASIASAALACRDTSSHSEPHDFALVAHVAGAPSDAAPLSFKSEVHCGPVQPFWSADGYDPGDDAGAPGDADDDVRPRPSGCAQTRRLASDSGSALLALLPALGVLVAATLRRRARARRHR